MYGCQKCGSTESTLEMRHATVKAGPGQELKAAGIIPVQRCMNEQCGALSTPCTIDIGNPAGLVPVQQPPPAPPVASPADEEHIRAMKMAELLQAEEVAAKLRAELVHEPAVPAETPKDDAELDDTDADPDDDSVPTAPEA